MMVQLHRVTSKKYTIAKKNTNPEKNVLWDEATKISNILNEETVTLNISENGKLTYSKAKI